MELFIKTIAVTFVCFVVLFGSIFLMTKPTGDKPEKPKKPETTQVEPTQTPIQTAQPGETIHVEYDLRGENEGGMSKLLSHYLESCDDVVARMYIPGTAMETPIVNSSYYFRRNLAGEYETNGVPFIEGNIDFMQPNHNAIVYGHRLEEKEDFGMLRDYTSQSFYDQHPEIFIETEAGETTWKIISVFTLNEAQDSFNYNECKNLSSASQRDYFISEIKKRNILKTPDYTYQENDEFITLSTCHYEVDPDDGRLVVVAVRK